MFVEVLHFVPAPAGNLVQHVRQLKLGLAAGLIAFYQLDGKGIEKAGIFGYEDPALPFGPGE